ncbi:CS domain-containing protein [Chloropicon primus]|uniref:Dynein axonemal assembly factor 4 n=1 Tax=Chloropicon primus TaxID=1764295 RepID=A0A5B8MJH7_9CHLO|nr:hypothetical protein A3770_04p31540 [Chloropicon primus]UPQ99848.1 CS domain-containing protein [Chloropicon primus]|eukprot:QDZ20636.1 hypothetical protein A3770_04p31540 [Chloropicon primus]
MAPLSPKWTWRQTEATVTADVDVKGVSKKACDIFLSDRFLKVNAPPYLLGLDLWGEIDEERSTATVSQGLITVHMYKRAPGSWDELHLDLSDRAERASVLERRKESIERAHKKQEEKRKERIALREREQREAQDRSFELDRKKRQAIDDAKNRELLDAREEIASFTSKKPAARQEDQQQKREEATDSESDLEEDGGAGGEEGEAPQEEESQGEEESEEEEIVILPPPREKMASVEVEFTPTIVDNLPAREGREEELKLIRRSQGKPDDLASETDLTERHPIFLKDKGDKMSKHGNFKGALRAYNRALEIDPSHLLCICNRSMCYLRLGEASKAEEDCRKALGMIAGEESTSAPEMEDSEKKHMLRIKMSGRLAKALAAQDRTKEVIEELENALKLSSNYPEIKESIQRDLDDAIACESVSFEGPLDQIVDLTTTKLKPKIESIKKLADTRIKQQDPKGALRVYKQISNFISEVRNKCDLDAFQLMDKEFLLEMKLACFSNSASAYLMLGDFVSSIDSCKGAISAVVTLFELYYDFPKDEEDGDVERLIALIEKLLDLLRETPGRSSHLFEGKREKYVLSLVRILRRMSSACGHLKDYGLGVKILEVGLTATRMCELGSISTEITKDLRNLSVLQAQHCK